MAIFIVLNGQPYSFNLHPYTFILSSLKFGHIIIYNLSENISDIEVADAEELPLCLCIHSSV